MSKSPRKPTIAPKPVAVRLERVLPEDLRPKIVTNILWTRVGSEVQIDLGYSDFADVHKIVAARRDEPAGEPQTLTFHVTDRVILTMTAMLELVKLTTSYVAELKDKPMLPQTALDDIQGREPRH